MSGTLQEDDLDADPTGSSVVPTAIPLSTGDIHRPRDKPRWGARLAKPIAYGFGVLALGAMGVVLVSESSTLDKGLSRNGPTPAAAVSAPVDAPEHAAAPVESVVVLDPVTIRWRPPLELPEPPSAAEGPERTDTP